MGDTPVFKWVRYDPNVSIILKGPEGSKDFLRTLQTGKNMGILLDQRLSEGEKVPFFGRPAYTPVVPARVAYKLGAKMIPVQVERLKGVAFRITYHKPLVLKQDATTSAQMINQLYEKWITEHPDQWLWFHNRWK
ncbi:MAG: lysophospholipid acyltransferase family protein [Holosporaceae bacterium]|nr:MAG: lysophospholipid acyltransferase family protein [Holosporaceae bacterium]